jgi:pyruvate ferredoxin oxidoreductase beta subunit
MTNKNLLSTNNSACLGCPQITASRIVINTLGEKTIIVNATGCLEITTASYDNNSWGVPFIHSLFSNPASVASGILASLKKQKKDQEIKILVQAGDGSTFDIGFSAISGMWSRGDDILYVCYDNEIYANTGAQSSSATPLGAQTKTSTNIFNLKNKKNMLEIALNHGLNYIAQTTSGYPEDIKEKITKAMKIKGPKYLQILCPCLPGWQIDLKDVSKIAQLAVQTGLYPSLEFINGKLTSKKNISDPKIKAEEYLKLQKRFKNLFLNQNKNTINALQKIADENIKKYCLNK